MLTSKRTFGLNKLGLSLAALALMIAAAGCGFTARQKAPAFSSTAMAQMSPALPTDQARREAISRAETKARDQIMLQVRQLRLADGRSLEDLAVIDPFVRAMVQDAVRNAHQIDRTVSDQGVVTVTLSMDQAPLLKLIETYKPATPAK